MRHRKSFQRRSPQRVSKLDFSHAIGYNRSMIPSFYSPYAHGFIRACVCIPRLRVADPEYNTAQTLGLAKQASEKGAAVALFPELGLSAYSIEDLFHQDALLEATLAALGGLKVVTENGWFAARPSGTEHIYKISAPARSAPRPDRSAPSPHPPRGSSACDCG